MTILFNDDYTISIIKRFVRVMARRPIEQNHEHKPVDPVEYGIPTGLSDEEDAIRWLRIEFKGDVGYCAACRVVTPRKEEFKTIRCRGCGKLV